MVSTKIIIIFQERWFNIPKEGKRIFKHSSGNHIWTLRESETVVFGNNHPDVIPYEPEGDSGMRRKSCGHVCSLPFESGTQWWLKGGSQVV